MSVHEPSSIWTHLVPSISLRLGPLALQCEAKRNQQAESHSFPKHRHPSAPSLLQIPSIRRPATFCGPVSLWADQPGARACGGVVGWAGTLPQGPEGRGGYWSSNRTSGKLMSAGENVKPTDGKTGAFVRIWAHRCTNMDFRPWVLGWPQNAGWVSDLRQPVDVCLAITQERWFTATGNKSGWLER